MTSLDGELDIPVDLNTEDESGFAWALLSRANRPERVKPGQIVVVGAGAIRAAAEVVDIVQEPAGAVVHFRVLRDDASRTGSVSGL